MHTFVGRALGAVLLAAVATAVPWTAAGDTIGGPSGGVEIVRDSFGVPHIYARSLAEANFGLGYCQAEDNLEPILAAYITARAEAARAFGRSSLESDYRLRVWNVPEISRRLYERMSPEARESADAFVEGINRYLADHPERKPAWFDRATGLDVVAAAKVYQLQQQYSVLREDLRGVSQAARERDQSDREPEASNMWAVAPSRTADGSVILESDPHLPWTGSTRWYEAQLVVGDRWVYGAGFYGGPNVGIGFNPDVAWGSTNNAADTADVYRESINPENPDQYLYDGQWRPVETETIELEVVDPKGRIERVRRPIRRTRHGPILSEDRRQLVAYAARVAGLETVNLVELGPCLFHARTIADLEKAYDLGCMFKWNRIAADRHGDIGYYFFAATHHRDDRFNWHAPVDGSVKATEWGEPMSWRELPHTTNPPSGFLVNCNNNPYTVTTDCPIKPDDYPRHLAGQSTELSPTTRAHRATELILAAGKLDLPQAVTIATDVKALTAGAYVEVIQDAYRRAGDKVPDPDGRLKRAVEILGGWDGMATVDNKALAILGTCVELYGQVQGPRQARKMAPEAVLRALARALATMDRRWGSIEVPWGSVHVTRRGDLELPIPGAGSTTASDPFTTLWMAGSGELSRGTGGSGAKWVTDRGSSWIQLVRYHQGDVEAMTIVPYGNTNLADSPHFNDQMPLFAQRKLKNALLTRAEVEAAATRTVRLRR